MGSTATPFSGGEVACVPEVTEVINGEARIGPSSDAITPALNPKIEGGIKLMFS